MTVQDPVTGRTRFAVVPASYVFLLRETDPGSGTGTEVLLQLRQNTGYMDGFWAAAAAGHVERGETAEAAARREALEEIAVADLELRFATAMQRTAHDLPIDERVDFFFTARSWSGEPRIVEPAKCADLRWFRLDALPEPVVPHEAVVLAGLRRGDLPALSHHGF
ncbi:NUDIX domain-containing protein [Nocardioides nitrophenolicus]|uniref:NUDIX domain-containing protein n=1 Tax=Nocardioides nitrophenolicus TaxID=60489 RepID=UPI0027DE6E8C|nr:NUDIX domain-containing protein [Nocardioides nitrophenolicus]MBM7516339.1 8-oxo-dGTP pyrophosphatase MutT (NUDIX family) [Nocardioides nitrophenolicus]